MSPPQEKPVDEILPLLKKKMEEWERKRRALPMISKWLHMHYHRSRYLRMRKRVVRVQVPFTPALPSVHTHRLPMYAHPKWLHMHYHRSR